MAKQTLKSTREKHKRLARHAQKQRDIAERVIHNIEMTKKFSDISLRTYLNNERLSVIEEYDLQSGVGGRAVFPIHKMYLKSLSEKLESDDNLNIIGWFALWGEPLCKKVINYLKSKQCISIPLGCLKEAQSRWMMYYSQLPSRMLARNLTEKEYLGITAGELPFTQAMEACKGWRGKKYSLPRKTK